MKNFYYGYFFFFFCERENICRLAEHIHEVPKVQAVPKPLMKECMGGIVHDWDECSTSQFPSKMQWNHCFYTHSISSSFKKQAGEPQESALGRNHDQEEV